MTISRLAIATGGTGGHIFPALAVAAEAKHRNPDCKVLFMGGSGPETRLAPEAGLDFVSLPAKGVLGKGVKGVLSMGWVFGAVGQAMAHLRAFSPDAVMGFGGYAGFCPLLAAKLKKLPCAIHEQNSVPGVTNRILGKVVDRVFLSFADDMNAFPEAKCALTGNPVRKEIFNAGPAGKTEKTRNLLILGGSQGAVAVNDAVVSALPRLLELDLSIRHQAGPNNEAEVRRGYAAAGADPESVSGFISDMAEAYQWADVALCRSGASTVFELAASGTASILVPFPQATHDHQKRNAKALQETGAALLLDQDELDAKRITSTMASLFEDPKQLCRMAEAAKQFSKPHAAVSIVDGMEALVNKAS